MNARTTWYAIRDRSRLVAIFVAAAVLPLGCSRRPSRVDPPAYDPAAGSAAIATYDTDSDQAIGGAELDRVPALRASLDRVDTDRDGRVTSREIDARVRSYVDSRVGLLTVSCRVTQDGVPLSDAQVTLEPEPFLGEHLNSGIGTTGPDGMAVVSLPAEHLPDAKLQGVPCGWYKVRMTTRAGSGQMIAARSLSATTLGCEVAMDAAWLNHGILEIAIQTERP